MDKVFVSHASADKAFVDAFVDNVLYRGLGLKSEEIFYSSERDTGVPSGADLMGHVRQEVSDTTLVVAIVTPMYQSRPVCVAEFGAAWGRAEPQFVFPLLAPGMKRAELQGVLRSLVTLSIDDESALDELSDRIKRNWNRDVSNAQWGVGKRKWLAALEKVPKLEVPDVPTAEEHEKLRTERDELSVALGEVTAELEEWKQKFDDLTKTKDAKAARTIRIGRTGTAQFQAAVGTAKDALRDVPPPVHEAIYRSLRGEGTPYPNPFEDALGPRQFDDALERNLLSDPHGEGIFYPNRDKRAVRVAVEAVAHLQDVLTSEDTPDFAEWFEDEYPDLTPDLRDRDCWEDLLE